jgi:AcrR family transcriptional regulator
MHLRNTTLREDMRQTILDAADRLIAHYGYKKTTIDDVAREAGIGKGTIYLYFKSKEEVALCSADRVFARVIEHLKSVAESADTPSNRLRRMLVGRVLYRFDSFQQYAHSLDDLFAALRPACMSRKEQWLEEEAKVFAEVLIEGRLLGTFDLEDAVLTARTLLIATNGLMPFSLTTREWGEREEVKQKVSRIVDILLNGLLKREQLQAP